MGAWAFWTQLVDWYGLMYVPSEFQISSLFATPAKDIPFASRFIVYWYAPDLLSYTSRFVDGIRTDRSSSLTVVPSFHAYAASPTATPTPSRLRSLMILHSRTVGNVRPSTGERVRRWGTNSFTVACVDRVPTALTRRSWCRPWSLVSYPS